MDSFRDEKGGIRGKWILLGLLVVAGGLGWVSFHPPTMSNWYADVTVPALSADGQKGRDVFNRVCAECHGIDASGGDKGPTLIHVVYRPGHHADGAFHIAALRGVRQHHWHFGAMPAQKDKVSKADVDTILAFVRETQRANGIQ